MPAQKTMRFKLRKIFSELEDSIEGTMLLSRKPVSFLGDIDVETGKVVAGDSDVFGERIAGRIFAFPSGRGSTVGTYTILQLAKNGKAPEAIINRKTESIIVAGAVISNIPLFDSPEPDIFAVHNLKPGLYRARIVDEGEFAILEVETSGIDVRITD